MNLMRLTVALVAVIGALLAVIMAPGGGASAHPLGNFTVNHYTRIDLAGEQLTVFRVLDLAEIPALQQVQRSDSDGDGRLDAAESDAYATETAQRLAGGMDLVIAGERIDLRVLSTQVAVPKGQGGLRTLRLEVTYTGALPSAWRDGADLAYSDGNDVDRLGWREVVIRAGEGVVLANSDALTQSISDELRAYPERSASSPPDMRSAGAVVAPGVGAPLPAFHPRAQEAVEGNPDGALAGFTDLIDRDNLGWGTAVLALLTAVGFGAVHALSPGHGKTIVAAYLVGSRGTWKHALFLAGVVTVTHTSSVYVLGFVALYLSDYVLAESLYPVLGLASGAVVLAMGMGLLVARLRSSGIARSAACAIRRALPPNRVQRLASERGSLTLAAQQGEDARTQRHHHDDAQAHDGQHDHAHPADEHEDRHSHGLGSHSHRIPGQEGERVTLKGLLALGIFGGMIPCPSAIVVMLSAISLHRVGFGLALIVAFSLGLASVLTAIGFALVFGRQAAGRFPMFASLTGRARTSAIGANAIRVFPVAAALAVVAAGTLVSLRALEQM